MTQRLISHGLRTALVASLLLLPVDDVGQAHAQVAPSNEPTPLRARLLRAATGLISTPATRANRPQARPPIPLGLRN